MKPATALLTLICVLAASAASFAGTWTHIGTAGFTVENPSQIQDRKRPVLNSMVRDSAGNIWVSCSYDADEYAPASGFFGRGSGVTVFKTGGGTANVDINALGYRSCITKLVEGGDGAIYALLNYSNLEWTTYTQFQDYILRLKLMPDNSVQVTEIYTPGPHGADVWLSPVVNKIGGMAVGGDGNIYWTQNGLNSYWRKHFFWRYNVYTQSVEEAPNRNGLIDECPGETHRLLDLEYLGYDQFAIVGAYSNFTWQCTPISWSTPAQFSISNTSNPSWGRRWNTANAYDPLRKKLWVGGRSESPYPEWRKTGTGATVVDLGDGNKGLQFVSVAGPPNKYWPDPGIPSAQETGAMRFRVDSFGSDATLMWIYGNARRTTTGNGLAVALKIRDGRFKLVDLYYASNNTGPEVLADLGSVVPGEWNELYVYIDAEARTCKATWNGSVVYQGPIGYQLGKNWLSWFEWGSAVDEPSPAGGVTATVTFDWVAHCIGDAGPGEAYSKRWVYLDGSRLPTGDPYYFLSNIMTRFDGNPTLPAMFDANGKVGTQNSYKMWHVNGYDELNSAVPGKRNQGAYWITTLAVNPYDGTCWHAYGAEATYEYEPWDRVRSFPLSFTGTRPPREDHGAPEPGSQVVSLMFSGGKVYALTCSPLTGAFNLYSMDVSAPGPTSVSGIKNKPLGTLFETDSPKLVTLQLGDSFYIQDDDRTSGIRVIPQGGAPLGAVGQRAAVKGFTDVLNGEAVVYASSVTLSSTSDVAEPLHVLVRNSGGVQTGIQPPVYGGNTFAYDGLDPAQVVSEEPRGLNTTGLLIRVTGKLRWSITSGIFEFVDDGSGFPILINFPSMTGASDGSFVSVTGVCTVHWNSDIKRAYRVITPRDSNDITIHQF